LFLVSRIAYETNVYSQFNHAALCKMCQTKRLQAQLHVSFILRRSESYINSRWRCSNLRLSCDIFDETEHWRTHP